MIPAVGDLVIAEEDPRTADVVELLEAHLALMRRISPPGHVHALDLDGLTVPAVTFLSARRQGDLLGVGALKVLDARRGEIKSMHASSAARGQGVGRQLVQFVIDLSVDRGLGWLGLETGTQAEFEPARSLYRSFGFSVCEPFGEYTVNPYSVCFDLDLPPRAQPVVSTGE